jgi:hypothetical protein
MQILHVKKVFLLRKVVCLFVWFAGLAYQGKDIVFRFIFLYNILSLSVVVVLSIHTSQFVIRPVIQQQVIQTF